MEEEKNNRFKVKNIKPKLLLIIIVIISVCIFSVALWFLKKERTREDTNNPKNAPGTVRNFMNDTSIGEDGKINSSKSIRQLWEEMKNNGNDILQYLDSAEELAKLIHAAQALDFPDTRENPDEPISWKDIDIDSTEIQGIVKFIRALEDGNSITMTYVTPSKFQELMNKYMETGKEEDKNEALKHFTIEETYSANSANSSSNSIGAKIQSLNGMVFMGDSILSMVSINSGNALEKEGAKTMYRGGCTANYFLGKETASGKTSNCKEKNGYFDWEANFNGITNPTGFYLLLGQNFCHDKNNRITQMDKLIQKIKSKYPSAPIYISSVLYHIDSDGSDKKAATAMNEELKVYCNGQSNVYYSDISRGYNDNLKEMSYDNDHPNEKGAKVLINNIKENIIGNTSTVNNSTASYSTSDDNSISTVNNSTSQDSTSDDNSIGETNAETSNAGTSNNEYKLQYQVKVAKWNEHQEKVVSNDPEIKSYDTGLIPEMTTTSIPYQPIVSKFKMPFNYIYSMLVYGQEKEFAFDLAELVKNSRIEITIHDNVSRLTNISTDTYKDLTEIRARAGTAVVSYELPTANGDNSIGAITVSDLNATGSNSKEYKVEYTTIYNTNYLDIALTLADSWYTRYEKSYTYNEPTENNSSTSTKLDDQVIDQHGESTLGGLDSKIDDVAKNKARNKIPGIINLNVIKKQDKYAHFKTTRTNRVNNLKIYTKSSSYIPEPANDYSTVSSVVTPKTGSLNKNNWVEFKPHYNSNGVFDSQQGFCLIGDDLIACVLHNWGSANNNKLNLIDAKTFKVYDTAIGFVGHGNTIAFDPKTEDLIIPGCDGKMNLIHVNRSTKRLENIRKVPLPRYTNDYSTIAYNATYDLFISDANIFTREAFYSRGERLTYVPRNAPKGRNYNGGCASYGNQIYHFFARPSEGFKVNYISVVNIITRKSEEMLVDGMNKEAQGIAFMSDGTLYTCYGSNPTSIWRTDYNYFYDTNIDKSNVTPGASGNSISMYNTGGVYTSKSGTSASIGETLKTGQLNKKNYINLPHNSLPNIQQGFCFVGDNLYAVSMWNKNTNKCKLYLLDMATFSVRDTLSNLSGHGNSLTYDSTTGDIIFPESNGTRLIHVNTSTNRFENVRKTSTLADDTALIAYNKQYDVFISFEGTGVYAREQFYAKGKAKNKFERKLPRSGLAQQAGGTYGNHVYVCYSSDNGNYILVCNIHTGKQEKVLYDNTYREIEEVDFTNDGTMYIIYGGGGKSLFKTDYNYFADNDIDKSNVTPATSGNSIAMYNTGGAYIDKSSFEAIFRSHYNARTNILSVTDWFFGALEQNSDTKRMVDLTKYLFYKSTGVDYGVTTFDFEAYQLEDIGTANNNGGGTTLDITSCSLTKEQFIQLTQSYSAAISKGSGTKTFRDNAGIIYDTCVKNRINPVLCAAQAWKEQNWNDPSTSPYNFWGIAVYNGQNYGKSWGSMEQAVQGYCDQINSQLNGKMKSTYQARAKQFATVNSKFKGDMSTIYDVFSAYAYIGDGHTLQEEADYAAKYVESLLKCATQIYGEGVLTGGVSGGDFLAVAQKIWKKVCNGNYSYGGSSIPCTGKTIDCSSYVSWVLYEYGYSDFKGRQHVTQNFKNTNWSSKYGWQEINVGGGENPYNSIQPGDIFVRDPGNNNGHVTLVVRKENGKIYCYDCGNSGNWRNNPNGDARDKSYMLTDKRPGKIIRVKPKT